MKKVSIGIDIGGTNVKIGLVDTRGRILVREVFPTGHAPGRRRLLETLCGRVGRLADGARRRKMKVLGVGVGAPGPIDVDQGLVYFFPNIPGWKRTPLRKILSRRLGLPVFLDNDANAMALAEFCFGAGRGARHMIGLTLGTGVGGGIVIDGRLFHGPRYSAAEIGHITINENGPACACGNRGCVEVYVGNGYFIKEVRRRLAAGGKSVLKRWVRQERRELTPILVERAARAGDRFSRQIWKETGEHLGTALAGLVNVLNPERIVIGGGVARTGELLLTPLRATIKKKAFPIAAGSVKVLPAVLGVDAGLIGAAALVFGLNPTTKR